MLSWANPGRGGGTTRSGLEARWCGPQGVTSFRERMEERWSVRTALRVAPGHSSPFRPQQAQFHLSLPIASPGGSHYAHSLTTERGCPSLKSRTRRGRAEPLSLVSLLPSSFTPFSEPWPSCALFSLLPSIAERHQGAVDRSWPALSHSLPSVSPSGS